MKRAPSESMAPIGSLARLLRLAERRVDAALRATLEPLAMGPRGYTLLSALAENGPMSQQQATQVIGVDRTSMVALVDSLEAERLVKRERDPADRRAHTLVLSATGEKRLRQAAKAMADCERDLLGRLDEKDVRRLTRALREISQPSPDRP